ncbi:MAG TPA: hypothetical protein VGR00_09110 [Thermoanaerobaculia bacterium]|nr:hypothetical protein [Thermoanaerobaculia bacterium]
MKVPFLPGVESLSTRRPLLHTSLVPASSAAAAGLAFALTLTDGGRSITSTRFALRAPGLPGSIVLEVQNPDLYGSTFAAPLRVMNETEGDLLAVSAEIVSVTETKVDAEKKETQKEFPGGEGQPPAWDVVKKGEASSRQQLRAGPVVFTEETKLVLLFGRVHGVALLGGFQLDEAPHPDALEADKGGNVWVRDAAGTILRTDADARSLAKVKTMPVRNEKPSGACAALGSKARLCREMPDGTLISASKSELTVTDPDGRSRSFSAGDDGPPVAIAFGKEGRVLVATAGEGARKGSVRIYRPF